MKATGIVRRIDELGRIVVPKEIRRTLRIREGDPLEIFTDKEGEIILKKYSSIGEISGFAKQYAENLYQVSGRAALITDRDRFVAATGAYKILKDQPISKELEKVIEGRKCILAGKGEKAYFAVAPGVTDYTYMAVSPVLCQGDIIGSVILLENDENRKMGEVEQKLVLSAASFIASHME
ncbi:MAG: AbrB/MazE/SpoVT family DNA-binding domain-containing protein [Lachnospiraceae bacterium]|nr:AbrB/MazE/SpoVT family DNA-binding domain-containing protein [Lachnospiraceae bacterium]